eukprot:963080-Lingulodinium_polyedra.AAC.1
MADETLDADIMTVMKQRLDIATHFLGVTFKEEPTPTDSGEPVVSLLDIQYATLAPLCFHL